jgi:quinol monooxygenase YgiN
MSSSSPHLAHMVYFALKDPSAESVERLVASCRKYLTEHEGTVYFGVGTRVLDLAREVNDQAFHVALQMVFTDRAAHDRYQVSERHQQFIAENRDSWAQVRVFDASVQ